MADPSARYEIMTTWREVGIGPGLCVRNAAILPRAAARAATNQATDPAATFRWILGTDAPTRVFDWQLWDFVDEILLMDGVIIPEIGQVPLLDSHRRNSVDDHLGSVRDFTVEKVDEYNGLLGSVAFSAADLRSVATAAKVAEGHLTDGSVGYRQEQSIWIPEDESAVIQGAIYQGPLRVTTSWRLMEFSITSIGADVLAKVRGLCGGSGK